MPDPGLSQLFWPPWSAKESVTSFLVETLLASPESAAVPPGRAAGEVALIMFQLHNLLPRAGVLSHMTDTPKGNFEVYMRLLSLLNISCASGFDKQLIREDANTLLVRREPFPN